ncbi:MAG: hypothetical protein HY870_16660 [Chloroflexi bacterium]|nr:hypothetical protein [Chloroflexota bacterium]
MTPQATPLIPVPELTLIGVLVFFFALWGWRHGLDAVILAGLFVLFGRISVDVLAVPVGATINMFYGIFELMRTGKFSGGALFAVIQADETVVKPLINVRDPNDAWVKLLGTVLFVMIAYIGFRVALKRAGGKDTRIEQAFGFVGGGALGYMCLTFAIDRHISFPQQIMIERSEVPQISVDAPLLVAIVMVLIVFGIQRSKAPAKKK